MANILCWNCRGFNKPKKRNLIKYYIKNNQIDILGLQKTKMKTIPDRILSSLSNTIIEWFIKPSVDNLVVF
jgi:exonuclease III